jgi:CelD/BcsL family acetyltransferase involved in cellulose biosynthesis
MLQNGLAKPVQPAREVTMSPDADALAHEWERLAERVNASPFLRPGWILAWLHAFGAGTPQVVTARRDGELVGVLPMELRRGRMRSPANYHSPLFGPVVADEDARRLLLEGLFGASRPSIELDFLAGDLHAIDAVARASGRLVVERAVSRSPVVDIAGCFEEYMRGLSRNRRKGLRRGQRALEAQGNVTFEVHRGLAGLDGALEDLFAVEASGWKGERGTAMSSHPHTRRFYSDVARWAADRDWLRLAFLRLDGRAIACDYSLEFDGVWYSLKSGYDESYRSFGPGALLLRDELEYCFERGLSRMELLGDADDFKLSWAARSWDRTQLHAFRRSSAGIAHWSRAAGRARLRPLVHRVRGRVRDGVARGYQALGSLLAFGERFGLEPLYTAV